MYCHGTLRSTMLLVNYHVQVLWYLHGIAYMSKKKFVLPLATMYGHFEITNFSFHQ